MTWHGPGTLGVCVACEQPIAADDVEVECDLPTGGTIRLHRGCYDIAVSDGGLRRSKAPCPKAARAVPDDPPGRVLNPLRWCLRCIDPGMLGRYATDWFKNYRERVLH